MLALRSRRTDVVWICRPGPHTRACSVRLDHGLRSLSHRNTRSEKDIVAGSGARRLGMFVLSRSRPTAGPNRGRRRQASSCSTRMTQKDSVLSQILGGRSDANVNFNELRSLLRSLASVSEFEEVIIFSPAKMFRRL